MLEKILEEIDAYIEEYHKPPYGLEVKGAVKLLQECKDIIRKRINDGWIPCDERMPDNAKHKGAFCPRYRILTEYGETVGWYNPDSGGWYVLLWFMTERFLKSEIDFDRGDIPKVIFFNKKDFVQAWKPFEPYRPEKGATQC